MNAHLSELGASVLNRALGRKGRFIGVLWNRPLKTRKGIASMVTKEVRCVARIGIDYDAQATVQAGRESGELPAENAGLPWGKWAQFPYLIEHKDSLYLRLYPVKTSHPKVIYRLNGQIARKEEIEQLCLASEFREYDGACITLNLNHLRRMR